MMAAKKKPYQMTPTPLQQLRHPIAAEEKTARARADRYNTFVTNTKREMPGIEIDEMAGNKIEGERLKRQRARVDFDKAAKASQSGFAKGLGTLPPKKGRGK